MPPTKHKYLAISLSILLNLITTIAVFPDAKPEITVLESASESHTTTEIYPHSLSDNSGSTLQNDTDISAGYISNHLLLHSSDNSRQQNNKISSVETLFGQVAKAVVYGGASVARLNNRVLCPTLTQYQGQTSQENEDQPTLFVFNNQHNREQAYRIYADDEITPSMIEESQFDSKQMTMIFVHGWLGGIHNEIWLSEAKNTALGDRYRTRTQSGGGWTSSSLLDDFPDQPYSRFSSANTTFRPNVIIVEWSEFALGSLYAATQNSLKVSRRLAHLLNQLASVGGLRPELMHCLGHSIGAHICGQAARQAFPSQPRPAGSSPHPMQQRRLGRITALDPGGFCYELGIKNETTYPGLRPSDALLVDAYYSNRSPFGNKYLVGQYNVRINNGYFQKACSVWLNPDVAAEYFRATARFLMGNVGNNEILTCDHYFATRFAYLHPASTCSYTAYACDSYRNFIRGRCGLCNSPAQCYSMDFEYQRTNSSVAHALEHIMQHSSYFNDDFQDEDDDDIVQPIGGVPYKRRRKYYMRISNEEPYCGMIFRVRVYLDRQIVDLRSFRNDWLKLQFIGAGAVMVRVKDASSGKLTDAVHLHGPWTTANENDAIEVEQMYGVDDRTLTALFELEADALSSTMDFNDDNNNEQAPMIKDVIVEYDNDLNRRQDPLANPIEFIRLDYLSSSDQKIRSQNSRLFQRHQFKVLYKHLDGSAKSSLV